MNHYLAKPQKEVANTISEFTKAAVETPAVALSLIEFHRFT